MEQEIDNAALLNYGTSLGAGERRRIGCIALLDSGKPARFRTGRLPVTSAGPNSSLIHVDNGQQNKEVQPKCDADTEECAETGHNNG